MTLSDALNIKFGVPTCVLKDASARRIDDKSLTVLLMAARGYSFYMGLGYMFYSLEGEFDDACEDMKTTNEYIKKINTMLLIRRKKLKNLSNVSEKKSDPIVQIFAASSTV